AVLRAPRRAAAGQAGDALQEAEQPGVALATLGVLDRRADEPLDLALLDDEGRRAEVALAADDVAGLEVAAHHRALVPAQKLPRHAVEERVPVEVLGADLLRPGGDVLPRVGADELAVGQRPGRARHHALAARHAARLPHRVVEVEGDAGRVALAHAADDLVVADVVAAADAAVAQDAGVVIDGDDHRRLVVAAVP